MAVSYNAYNHTLKLLLNKEVVFTSIKVKLLNATATFDATHTTVSQVDNSGAYEVNGNGWTAGGPTLTSVAVTQVTTNDAMLDADDVSVTASGGSIGPTFGALVYDSTSNKPLLFINFGASQQAGDTTAFKIIWDVSGLLMITI